MLRTWSVLLWAVASQSVTVNPLPVVSITPSGPTTFCSGNSVVLDAGAGFASYSWNTTPVQTTRTITVTASGNYVVTVTDGNGCQNTAVNEAGAADPEF